MSIDLKRFHATYFEESREGLDAMEEGLLALEAGETGAELINSIFRAAHSIKGGAATFGFSAMAGLTHILETLLDDIRGGKRGVESEAVDAMLGSVDVLRELIAEAEHGEAADQARVQAMHERLEALLGGEGGAAKSAAAGQATAGQTGWTIAFQPEPDLFMAGNDPLRIIRELAELGPLKASPRLDALPSFEALDPLQASIGWTLELDAPAKRAAVEGVFAWVEDACRLELTPIMPKVEKAAAGAGPAAGAAKAAGGGSGRDSGESSIRVDVDKVDALINLVGELVVTQSMLQQLGAGVDASLAERMSAALEQLERNTRDLQDMVIGIRMLPVDAVFRRFPRLVRDLSGKLGKLVRLQVSGENTELDKGLVEQIADPLVHLVRNAIDHGLEEPAVRAAAGKEPTGTIRLAASHQDGHVVIEVADDGKGLDRDGILNKARERGLPLPEEPTDSQIWDLIFHPGFSTASAVTDLSGRGVGMDVVRSNIRKLGGSVQLHSAKGSGTRVVIRLPLTLAIMDGMTVSAGPETLVLPLANVREALQPAAGDISTVKGRGRLLKVRDEYLTLLSLGDTFGCRGDAAEAPVAVVVESDGHRLAVEVDALLGQQQIVVKSLERNYRRIDGISGATILGDGQVALIVDVGGLARSRLSAAAA